MKAAWVDGSFEERISPHDDGFLLGLGVFETVGVFDGALPLWPAHMRRLSRNAEALDIPFSPPEGLQAAGLELLARAGDDVLRVTLTAGVEGRPTWCMTTRRRVGSEQPVRLHPVAMSIPHAVLKSTSRAAYVLALREAHAAGADDALLIAGGHVAETTTGNVFFWKGDVLHTPRLDGSQLPGVGRRALLTELGSVHVEESDCAESDLVSSDGLFVTNAVHGPRSASLGDADAVPLRDAVVEAWRRATATSG